jgi:hypothetical protein
MNWPLFEDCKSNVICLRDFLFFFFFISVLDWVVPNFSLNILDLVNFCEDFSVSL